MSDNIKVVVKVRPLISREIEDKLSYQWRVKNNTLYQLDQNGKDLGPSFTFDRVYDKDTKTSDVYDDIAKPIVQAATAGFNGTIFAYGQTSSGKTYTMTGTDSSPGIIPLAVLNLFEIIRNVPDRDFLVRVSYIEIYNETVKDLLNVEKENIKIHETHQGIKMDATEKVTSSPEEVLAAMKEGEANRQKGATNMNEQSSRSHSIFQIVIESREHIEGKEEAGCVNVSQLNLVDLAGSERSGQTGATGIRFKEGTHINKSLSALALVIKQLSEDPNKYANYRDSKLTRILQNSLGGNAKTSIICAITPACVEETISTLQFANRAKAIKNKPEVNAVATDATMIQSLTKQMCKLQAQLESKKNLEKDNYKLQSKIASLQKLILNGFAQRRSVDLISGTRRKLQQPRRITISTLHSIEDEPVVNTPKFCTPSLKYNPMSIPGPAEFLPPQASSKLPSVPEEPRLVTPPPTRSVYVTDDIITLDSDDDDDNSARDDVKTCSPIHKCYASKTPPCILRRNAKLAEKNLNDIVELTEREKVYTPSVVEYIEKLEQNATVIAKLEDKIDMLSKQSKEKDLEMDHLKSTIKRAEEEMKCLTAAKIDLLAQCDSYNTRLTDAEVSYETLRNKAKLREEELLSLLEELTVRNKKPDDIGKIMSRTLDKELHFMDMSKDISLVNSDNESSIVNTNDVDPKIVNDLVTDTLTQLNTRNQNIIELEANVSAHQKNISSLESLNQDLQEKVAAFKEKLALMENENDLLKITIDTLNLTNKGLKENLETANNDIDSYNSLIQELQIKITQKENLPNININDRVLENMIANEEKFIANNENMKNIVHSLKIALNLRNKEIEELKTTLLHNKTLTDQLESQSKEVDTLNEEIDKLRKEINEHIAIISKLMHENNNHKIIEQELSGKLASLQEKSNRLEKINNENDISMKRLTEENHKLTFTVSDKNISEQELSVINKQLLNQIEDMTQKIADLEKDIRDKDDIISSLKKDEKQSQEYLHNAKAAVQKSQQILGTLSGNMQEVPEIIDNFVNIFNVLGDSMNSLEIVANDIVRQKEEAIKTKVVLETVIEELNVKHNSEISALQQQIENLNNKAESRNIEETETLTRNINQLRNELQITREELDTKISECKTLQVNLHEAMENIEKSNQIIATLNTEKANLEQTLVDRKTFIANLTIHLEEKQNQLKEKISEIKTIEERLNNSHQERNELLNDIFIKVRDFSSNFNIKDDGEDKSDCSEIHQRILVTLDKIVSFMSLKNVDDDNEVVLEAKHKIVDLTKRNLGLVEQLSEIENINNKLSIEFERIKCDNKNLNKELFGSQDILQGLQKDLKLKANELSSMEVKVRAWKDKFTSLDLIMKQQMYELKSENEYLKDRISDFRQEPENRNKAIVTYENEDSYDIDNNEASLQQKVSDPCSNYEIISPPSLLTICCNKIIDFIQPKEIDSNTTTMSSRTEVSVQSDDTFLHQCKCNQLSTELKLVREENSKIIDLLKQKEAINQHLIEEQEAIRSEIQHLVAPAQELQKKIVNHKTNLAILTATTYAENWSLKSQVKVLEHHHSRYHNVCKRDIPNFKKLLNKLMTLLERDFFITDQQNASFKRYSLPDVLDNSTVVTNFKNESTLDGDLLMLDTNITITTAADNTLTGHDETCLDLTQLYNEASCQTNELNHITDHNTQEVEILRHDYHNMNERLNMLKDENDKLRQLIKTYTEMKQCMVDTQSSPIKTNNYSNNDIICLYECANCKNKDEDETKKKLQHAQEKLNDELKALSSELTDIKSQKVEIERKYNNLLLETPTTDMLVKKLSTLEKDYMNKLQEIDKLSNTLDMKTQELKRLQEENDLLSTQVMENISEADDLNKELEDMKKVNSELLEKCSKSQLNEQLEPGYIRCSECVTKDELIQTMQKRLTNTRTELNRSLSDSDTSSRYNKICTLQSELHAGREDCKELTENVITIKNHLERSNLSMDLDDSMGESSIYTYTNEFGISSPQSNKCNMPDIPEERMLDVYAMDKIDCLNYYVEKTGKEKDTIHHNVKIIELMKMFYEYLITEHGNEVANITNKLKDFEQSKSQLGMQICDLIEKNSQVTMELKQKDQNYNSVSNALSKIKNNIDIINQEILSGTDIDVTKLVDIYKDQFFKVLDSELGLSSINIFEFLIDNVVNKHQNNLMDIMDRYIKLQENSESVTKELNSVNENLAQIRSQLTAKENEYNLLHVQKERVHEISNAVTLDLVTKDKELTEIISNGYKKLIELSVIDNQNVDMTLPLNINVNLLFEHLINQHKKMFTPDMEKETLALEVKKSKQIIEEKEKEIELLQARSKSIQEINSSVTISLVDKENQLQAQKTLHEDLIKIYERKVEENKTNVDLIEKLTEEINLLKTTIEDKEKIVENFANKMNIEKGFNEKDVKIAELIEAVKVLQDNMTHLKAMNSVIMKEKDDYGIELLKSGETIKRNSTEMDKMTSDILILRESVRENGIVIENLNLEVKNLMKHNMELKDQLEEKCKECFRLETNIKTHEKTAEVQARMISRLQKQRNEDENTMSEKTKQIEELTHKCATLQNQYDALHSGVKDKDELELLRKTKETLEARVCELEALLEGHKSRLSIDAIADSSRRRRQSLHDSKRLFADDKHDSPDHNNLEAVFESRPKPDDLFMDVDENISNRSSPIRLSKGRESLTLSLSRTDQSDKDEEHPSRPSSVVATRRRRQSIHDLHRTVLRHTPSPHGLESSNRIIDEFNHSKPPEALVGIDSEVSKLRECLASCQQELEDLKEKYRELDEECETCAEYLRERDEQCSRLKKERAALQLTITQLKEQLQSPNLSQQNASKPTVAHVAVNTDEDWTNLHSVVVDRMSFDAEVEKNKRLTKTIEELRFKKQDLKNTLAKMQKALERNSGNRELESTKQELMQLRERYKELDEECETCAQYLRDKEEQCRRLKEAKSQLEAKLQEFQSDVNVMAHSTRKKRQSVYDQNRPSTVAVTDASTETSDDFLSYQVERDGSVPRNRPLSEDTQTKEMQQLKLVVKKLSQQKAILEQQLANVSAAMHVPQPMYVATGSAIVQNQQITDVMKENQKLKKLNAKLVTICKKRGKDSNRENEDPTNQS